MSEPIDTAELRRIVGAMTPGEWGSEERTGLKSRQALVIRNRPKSVSQWPDAHYFMAKPDCDGLAYLKNNAAALADTIDSLRSQLAEAKNKYANDKVIAEFFRDTTKQQLLDEAERFQEIAGRKVSECVELRSQLAAQREMGERLAGALREARELAADWGQACFAHDDELIPDDLKQDLARIDATLAAYDAAKAGGGR